MADNVWTPTPAPTSGWNANYPPDDYAVVGYWDNGFAQGTTWAAIPTPNYTWTPK